MSEPRLRAPREHGQILAVPPFDQVGALLEANRRLNHLSLFGRSIAELRTLARRELLAVADEYHRQAGEPIASRNSDTWLVSGHQPELFHPGVWFKNFALHRLANKHGATAVNLIIDTDAAKPAILHAPAEHHIARLPFDRSTQETAYEERSVEDEAIFASLPQQVAPLESKWGFAPMLPAFWQEVMTQAKRTPLLGERFVAARRAFERRWGVVQREAPMSRVCAMEAFAWFAGAILRELPRFFDIYNETVRDYRQVHHIRSRSHPVPDLVAEDAWRETPFWAWRAGQTRRGKLFMRPTGETWELRVDRDNWPTIPAGDLDAWRELQMKGFKIRPRALTTTMFARLLLADAFMHGIGGGIYDALTDRIIERYFGVPAPGYLIVSATLLLPLSRVPGVARHLHDLERLQRDLVFQPERFVHVNEATAPWVQSKKEWIARNAATHAERVERFRQLRAINQQLGAHLGTQIQQAHVDHEQTLIRLEQDKIAGRRDYAFCLFPEKALRTFFTSDSGGLPF